jgi:hypothetical protein
MYSFRTNRASSSRERASPLSHGLRLEVPGSPSSSIRSASIRSS